MTPPRQPRHRLGSNGIAQQPRNREGVRAISFTLLRVGWVQFLLPLLLAKRLPAWKVAVRSFAPTQDGAGRSFAGLHASLLRGW